MKELLIFALAFLIAPEIVPTSFQLSAFTAQAASQSAKKSRGERQRARHTEAYKKSRHKGEHINIKVTPPERRGKKGHVLVEVYNFSKKDLSLVDFDIRLENKWGDIIEAHVDAEDMVKNWSSPIWIKIPGNGKMEKITGVKVQRLQLFDKKGGRVRMPYAIDLIKE